MTEPPCRRGSVCAAVVAVLFWIIALPAAAQDAAGYFEANCTACHTIGDGELNGPDLKGVTRTRDGAWLHRFISNPEAMVKAGDPAAVAIAHKYEDAIMPTPEGLTPQLLDDLILYIDRQSSGGAAATPEAAEVPFTPADIAAGQSWFIGRSRLSGGGVACSACHRAGPASALGGGKLGPDLTFALQRLQGTRGATAWLKAPPTPVMRKLFRERPLAPEELRAIVAFLDHTNTSPPQRQRTVAPGFLLSGLFGAVVGLVVFDRTWKGRLGRRGHR